MTMSLVPRRAVSSDADLLGILNEKLIQDEGHRNAMTVIELQQRMRDWLTGEYNAVLFENEMGVVAYALFREEPALIYLRQLYVERNERRKGVGREAVQLLQRQFWNPKKRLTVDVLSHNTAAIAFWKKVGFQEYSLTLDIMPSKP